MTEGDTQWSEDHTTTSKDARHSEPVGYMTRESTQTEVSTHLPGEHGDYMSTKHMQSEVTTDLLVESDAWHGDAGRTSGLALVITLSVLAVIFIIVIVAFPVWIFVIKSSRGHFKISP